MRSSEPAAVLWEKGFTLPVGGAGRFSTQAQLVRAAATIAQRFEDAKRASRNGAALAGMRSFLFSVLTSS